MKLIFVSLLVAAVSAAPQGYQYPVPSGPTLQAGGGVVGGGFGAAGGYNLPAAGGAAAAAGGAAGAAAGPVIEIVKDERVDPDGTGAYSFTYETSDGTSRTESGTPGNSGAVAQQGEFSYTLPDGQVFTMTFVADHNGYQPQSPFLPPLPDFVLEQIEFAKNNPEPEAAAGGGAAAGGAVYGAPAAPQVPAPSPPSQSYIFPGK